MKLDAVVELLRTRILAGEFGTSGRLPSYTELCEQMGTSRETVNKSRFAELKALGQPLSQLPIV